MPNVKLSNATAVEDKPACNTGADEYCPSPQLVMSSMEIVVRNVSGDL